MVHIVGIAGSLRKASTNHGLLRAFARHIPAPHTVDIIVPDLPLYNNDLEVNLPQSVKDYRQRLKKSDAVVFGSTEYNYSISAPLKNAIDWGSRGDSNGNLFNDKPGGSFSTGGGLGGARSVLHLHDSAVYVNLHMMNHPQIFLRIFENPHYFDKTTGDLLDPKVDKEIAKFAEHFLAWTLRLRGNRG